MSAAELAASVEEPWEVDFGDGRTVILSDIRTQGEVLICTVTRLVDGEERTFSNPWKIVNPPGSTEEDFREIVLTSGFFR